VLFAIDSQSQMLPSMPYSEFRVPRRPSRDAVPHRREPHAALVALAVAAGLAPASAFAQSASPGAVVEEVIVIAPDNAVARRFSATPGGGAILTGDKMPSSINLTVSRALAAAPGVVVQDFFGGPDQPRIQIRGSGLQQNPVERGVLVLENGLPLNRADGSYVVGFANPGQVTALEVYRGYTANRLGATVLGGALNFVTPTGRDAPGGALRASGGSFGQYDVSVRQGVASPRMDLLAQGEITGRDGYREYNRSRRASLGANLGVRLSETVSARLFARYADLDFDVSGPLTREQLDRAPDSVFAGPTVTPTGAINPGPNVPRDRPRREASQAQLGARATATLGAHVLDVALGYVRTDDRFRFPISAGERVTDGGDGAAVLRYAYKPDGVRALPLLEMTAQYAAGAADREYYLNRSGQRGALFGRNRLKADTLALNLGLNLPQGEHLTVSPSLSWSHATRDNEDRYGAATRPTAAYNPAKPALALPDGAVPALSTSYARTYEGWSPALGLSWRLAPRQTLFAAASRSFEPPTHEDLLATINGTPNSSPGRPNPAMPNQPAAAFSTPALKAQRALTLEAGWRGATERLTWDAVVYHAWLRDELLSLRDETGVSLGAVNAAKTRHLGVEIGLAARLATALSGDIAYTYQDFRFHNDPVRGDHRLAGAPRHWINASLNWRPADRWTAQAALHWSPEKTPVDNLGTLYNDPYATLDLRAEYRLAKSMTVYAEVTNLLDTTYAASTLIVDQARPDQAVFLPGDGRAIGAGVRLAF